LTRENAICVLCVVVFVCGAGGGGVAVVVVAIAVAVIVGGGGGGAVTVVVAVLLLVLLFVLLCVTVVCLLLLCVVGLWFVAVCSPQDVVRTFVGHRYFDSVDGKNALRRILTMYAFRNPEVCVVAVVLCCIV